MFPLLHLTGRYITLDNFYVVGSSVIILAYLAYYALR